MSSQLSLLSLALVLPLSAQSNNDSSPAPIEIVSRISSVDAHQLTGENGTVSGLFLEVHNVSSKNVIGYSLDVKFVDPSTNTNIKGSHGRMASRQGNPLHPGDCDCSNAKPIVIRVTASGVLAEPKLTVDLVVFDDGTTWGAGQLPAARQLRKQLGLGQKP
jgi:hypothetical protein